jgi:hypothetical protein
MRAKDTVVYRAAGVDAGDLAGGHIDTYCYHYG